MTNIEIAAAVVVAVLSVARTARLVVHDDLPPVLWFRDRWERRWGDAGWGKLIFCHFCTTPYLAVGMALWAWLAFLHGGETAQTVWWVVNGVWGLSYVSAIIVSYDQPAD